MFNLRLLAATASGGTCLKIHHAVPDWASVWGHIGADHSIGKKSNTKRRPHHRQVPYNLLNQLPADVP